MLGVVLGVALGVVEVLGLLEVLGVLLGVVEVLGLLGVAGTAVLLFLQLLIIFT